MKVLVIGGGGREHAMAWRLAQSPRVQKVYVAPGNGGTAQDPRLENVAIDAARDPAAMADFVQAHGVALTVVGPEAPLAKGVVDLFRSRGLKIFGPTAAAAQLESSKDYAKQFMQRHRIPTAQFQTFSDAQAAHGYIDARTQTTGLPIVIKADGLAAGKGVVVASTLEEAHGAVDAMLLDNRFGDAGARVVIEDFLQGEEASFIVMCDGEHAFALATSQDHKRIGDGDTGPNTGGMGAYSPAPIVTPQVHARVMREIIRPVLQGMKAEGHPYTGFLYAGLMINAQGEPRVVEFNCRMGDPETQPIFLRMRGDFTVLLEHAIAGSLDQIEALSDTLWDPRPAVGVVIAAQGYPDSPCLGDVITRLPGPQAQPADHHAQPNVTAIDAQVFHAGTALKDGQLVTSGGRVLCATAMAGTLKEAQHRAYALVDAVAFDGAYCRRDIGWRALK